jgi:hypothetical protein
MCHYESWQCHCTKVPELLSKYYSTSMRCAVVSIFIALAFGSQAFAVLRALFPVKPEPPFSGESCDTGQNANAGVSAQNKALGTWESSLLLRDIAKRPQRVHHSTLLRLQAGLRAVGLTGGRPVKIPPSQNRSELCAFASRTPASGFQGNRIREMLYVTAAVAFPSHRTLYCSICFNAFSAVFRIASRAAFSVLTAGSINPISSAEVYESVCGIYAPQNAETVF